MNRKTKESWLSENVELRMDANVDHVPQHRRDFHKARYFFAAEQVEGLKVLDGACGTGYGSNILSQKAKHVTGIDIDPNAIQYAKEQYGSDSTDFFTSSVELTPFEDSSFDAIVSYETVEHTLTPDSHFREMVRLLSPDGLAFMTIPNNWGLTDHHFFNFDKKMLEEFANTYFDSVELYSNNPSKDFDVDSGIHPLASDNKHSECILAICRRPKKNLALSRTEHVDSILSDIYKNSFARHNEYLRVRNRWVYSGIAYRIKSILRRVKRRLQLI